MITARQAPLFAILPLFAAGCALLDGRNGNDGENNTSSSDMGTFALDMKTEEDMVSSLNTMTPTDMNTTPSVDMAQETTPSIVSTFEVIEEFKEYDGVGEQCVAARCPEGKKLLGGGGVWFEGVNITSNAQRNLEQAWVIRLSSEVSGQFKAQAFCAATDEEIVRESGQVSVPRGQSDCVEVSCDSPMLPISGGPRSSSNMRLTENRRKPNSAGTWQTCGTYEGMLDAKDFTASNLCIRGSANASAVRNGGGHPGGGKICISASCGEDLLVGGGGRWDSERVEVTSSSITDFNSWTLCGTAPERFSADDDVWEVEAICLRTP